MVGGLCLDVRKDFLSEFGVRVQPVVVELDVLGQVVGTHVRQSCCLDVVRDGCFVGFLVFTDVFLPFLDCSWEFPSD